MEKFDFIHPAHNFAVGCLARIYHHAPKLLDKTDSSTLADFLMLPRETPRLTIYTSFEYSFERWDIDPILRKNIRKMTDFLNLTQVEEEFLTFSIVHATYPQFSWLMSEIWDEMTYSHLVLLFSLMLDVPTYEAERILLNLSTLSKAGLVYFDLPHEIKMSQQFASYFYRDHFVPKKLLTQAFSPAKPPKLKPSDYEYLREYEMLKSYLKAVVEKQRKGSHLLIYGPPGSGKTELIRLLAREIKAELYEPTYGIEKRLDEMTRFLSYKTANYLLRKRPALILFDDADTFLNRMVDKAWFNRILEGAPVPTVWICNTTYDIDPALIRRFDLIIYIDYLPEQARQKMLRNYLGDVFDDETKTEMWITKIARRIIPPSLAEKTRDVLLLIKDSYNQDLTEAATMIMNHTLRLLELDEV